MKMRTRKEEKPNVCMPVRVADIVSNPNQPRKNFNEKTLKELADSLRKYGMIHPVVVQRKGRKYELVAGERRWRGAKRAGLKAIPATVREGLTEEEAKIVSLIENLCREDLSIFEEAEAFKELRRRGWTEGRIGSFVGKSQSYVAHRLSALNIPKETRAAIISHGIPASHVEELCSVEDPARQKKLVEEMAGKLPSCKKLRERICETEPCVAPRSRGPKCELAEALTALNEAATQRDFEGNCGECGIHEWCSKVVRFVRGLPL
jgi:ParB family chromosome partitioning protein